MADYVNRAERHMRLLCRLRGKRRGLWKKRDKSQDLQEQEDLTYQMRVIDLQQGKHKNIIRECLHKDYLAGWRQFRKHKPLPTIEDSVSERFVDTG